MKFAYILASWNGFSRARISNRERMPSGQNKQLLLLCSGNGTQGQRSHLMKEFEQMGAAVVDNVLQQLMGAFPRGHCQAQLLKGIVGNLI